MKPKTWYLSATVLAGYLLLFPPAPSLWLVGSLCFKSLFGDEPGFVEAVLTPGSGLEVLPEPALVAMQLLRKHGVREYEAPPGWKQERDDLLYQRLTEAAWPAQPVRASRFRLFAAEQTPPQGCTMVEEHTSIKLARCGEKP